jgi:hypothetical protein
MACEKQSYFALNRQGLNHFWMIILPCFGFKPIGLLRMRLHDEQDSQHEKHVFGLV